MTSIITTTVSDKLQLNAALGAVFSTSLSEGDRSTNVTHADGAGPLVIKTDIQEQITGTLQRLGLSSSASTGV
jgi:hypothetical protein